MTTNTTRTATGLKGWQDAIEELGGESTRTATGAPGTAETMTVEVTQELLNNGFSHAPSPATGGELDVETERRAFREVVRNLYERHMGPDWEIMLFNVNGGDFAFKVWLEARRAATGTPAKSAPGEWISMAERMPKDCEIVLVFHHEPHDPEPQIWSAQWLEGSETFESTANGWVHAEEVSHWMPLPPPPEQSQPAGSARQGGEHAPSKVDSPVGAKEQDK